MKARPRKPPTRVRDYMTPAPVTIEPERSLAEAHQLMRARRIRHIPVVKSGKMVGIVSQRDLMLIESLPDVNPGEVPVEDAMTNEVFTVTPTTPVAAVADRMADWKWGSAVVVDSGRVVGVFTVTDACHALARTLGGESSARRRR